MQFFEVFLGISGYYVVEHENRGYTRVHIFIIIRNACARMRKRKEVISEETTSCAQDETRTHTILRPLPPQSSVYTNFTTCACPEQDSNLHTSRHAHLKRTRLPIPPSGLAYKSAKKKSGKRDSNSRPRPWQGRALPTELFPQFFSFYKYKNTCSFSKAGAKVLLFFDMTKFFGKKMQKKCNFSDFMPIQGMKVPLLRASKPAFGYPAHSPRASIQTIHATPI